MSHDEDDGELIMAVEGLGGLTAATCWTMLCAECLLDWAEAPGARSHFDTAEQAQLYLLGDGGFTCRVEGDYVEVLCPGCRARADCADDGHHRYSPWQVLPHDPELEYRRCLRCGDGYKDRLTAHGGRGDQA
jgi:hypothetical protein